METSLHSTTSSTPQLCSSDQLLVLVAKSPIISETPLSTYPWPRAKASLLPLLLAYTWTLLTIRIVSLLVEKFSVKGRLTLRRNTYKPKRESTPQRQLSQGNSHRIHWSQYSEHPTACQENWFFRYELFAWNKDSWFRRQEIWMHYSTTDLTGHLQNWNVSPCVLASQLPAHQDQLWEGKNTFSKSFSKCSHG